LFGGYGLALAALALVVFGAIECPPGKKNSKKMNCVFTGTLSMGLFCLCVGKARFSTSDTFKSRIGAMCVDVMVSATQLFTVLFCLVGWGWSIWWGVICLRLASK